jgi:hypothetical protein
MADDNHVSNGAEVAIWWLRAVRETYGTEAALQFAMGMASAAAGVLMCEQEYARALGAFLAAAKPSSPDTASCRGPGCPSGQT